MKGKILRRPANLIYSSPFTLHAEKNLVLKNAYFGEAGYLVSLFPKRIGAFF